MRALTRREAFVAGSAGLLLLLIACSKVLGIEPASERAASDAGSIIDATPSSNDGALPPLGEKDAACGDTTSDTKNCGECGRDCLGGKCTEGRCEPTVFVFGLQRPTAISVDDEALYWVEATAASSGSAVRRCELGGCPNGLPRTLFEKESTYYSTIAVDGDVVYALRSAGRGIDTCNRLGCSNVPALINAPATSFALGPQQKAYYTTPAASGSTAPAPGVWRCENTPSCYPKTNIHPKGSEVRALGADLYVLDNGTSQDDDGVLLRCIGASCTSPKTLASGLSHAWPKFVASKQGVGWIGKKGTDIVLFMCEPQGCAGGPKTLAKIGGYVESFAFDDKYLYWANSEYSTIERVAWASTDAEPEPVLTKQGLPVGITIRDGVLYFTRSSFGDIVRYVPPP